MRRPLTGRIAVVWLLVTVFAFLTSYAPTTNTNLDQVNRNEVLMKVIMQNLKRGHYENQPIDDNFSKNVFGVYLKRLDLNKRFLIQSDIDDLMVYQTQVDDELQQASFKFFETSVDLITKRTAEAQGYYQEILSQPFDFTKEEHIELDPDKREWAANKEELKDYWRRSLKYQVLTRLADKLKEQEKQGDETMSPDGVQEVKSFDSLEAEVREKVLKNHDDWFDRMNKWDNEDRISNFMNAVVNTYDPHTVYFPPKDKENFDIAMSGQLEGIGASLSEKGGYIKVERIVVGSASYKQGDLEAGDLILKVAQADSEPVDVVDMRLDKVVQLIRGKKGTEVILTAKKVDGRIMEISIIRDVVNLEETYAKSAILTKDKSKKKVGYIDLPKFYADFNKADGRNCAEDVQKEVMKLKEEGCEGIILDLRDNGGGSLNDVVKMAGLFIKRGPIVQVKSRTGEPYVLKDNDPEIYFTGPLIIMVNSFSASASEIMAAAMQDYNRAIIIGSETTFGKGTVQRMYNLDNYLTLDQKDLRPMGAIKLTTQKFYRIDGRATQLKGMAPQIVMPDNYKFIDIGEKEHDYAIAWDEIKAVPYEMWQPKWGDAEKIIKNSQERIANNSVFQMVNENANRMKNQRDKSYHTLKLSEYRAEQAKLDEESSKYKDMFQPIPDLNVDQLKADMAETFGDSAKVEKMQKWHESIKKDAYIDEAMAVMKEMF